MNTKTNIKPPVVVIMGHIDHGKSTLLDYIRKSNTAEREAGGITQHISAYEAVVSHEGGERKITFIDTPGHEAFRSMRDSGSQAADIAVLVVSADDGVKPQTLEAIEWIKNHKLPFVVAITKIDKPGANVDMVKQTLAETGIYVEGYGGDVSWASVSSKTGQGINELLGTILLVADVNNIHDSNPEKMLGVIIESHQDPKKGVTATAIIKNGTLIKKGFVATKSAYSPLRIVENFLGKPISEISAGSPVRIVGWDKAPLAGEEFLMFENKNGAIDESSKASAKVVETTESTEKKIIPLVLRADTTGSLEALKFEVAKFNHERVKLQVISQGIGNLSENDVKLGQTDNGCILVGFHTSIDTSAKALSERMNVKTIINDIIYKLVEELFEEVEKRTPKIISESALGKAKILKFFSKTRDKQIVGGKVLEGTIKLGSQVNILRRETKIGVGKIKELQYMKERVSETAEGKEFGALIEAKIEIAPGDEVVAF